MYYAIRADEETELDVANQRKQLSKILQTQNIINT